MDARDVFLALQDGRIDVEEAKRLLAQSPESQSTDAIRGLVLTDKQTGLDVPITPWSVPDPAADEISIRVKASAVNLPDIRCIRGQAIAAPSYPFVPGLEVAGVITAVGSAVGEFRPGDAVIALTGPALGGHADMVNLPAENAVLKPAHLSFEDACSLPVVFCKVDTALRRAGLNRGDNILIQSAMGGCGMVALQLASLVGAAPWAGSSRSSKRLILHSLEVPHVFDHTAAFDEEVKSATQGRGQDVVINIHGGGAVQKGLNCLAAGGRYVELSVQALKNIGPLDLSHLVANQKIITVDLAQPGSGFKVRDSLSRMVQLLEQRLLVPIVSRIYPLEDMAAALNFVDQGAHVGKVVISHTSTHTTDLQDRCLVRLLEQKHLAKTRREFANPYAVTL